MGVCRWECKDVGAPATLAVILYEYGEGGFQVAVVHSLPYNPLLLPPIHQPPGPPANPGDISRGNHYYGRVLLGRLIPDMYSL